MGREKLRRLTCLTLLAVTFIGGCSSLPPLTEAQNIDLDYPCRDFYESLESARIASGTHSMRGDVVAEFPFIRTSRFLASYRASLDSSDRLNEWFSLAMEMDSDARVLESNIIDQAIRVKYQLPSGSNLTDQLHACQQKITVWMDQDPRRTSRVVAAATPDAIYRIPQRYIGVYPLTKYPMLKGVARWHESAHAMFNHHSFTRPKRWQPGPSDDTPIRPVRHTPLGVPQYTEEGLSQLFAQHAPIWEVEQESTDDVLVRLVQHAGTLGVDTLAPTTYTYLSYGHSQQGVLVHLNYVIWFSGRPKDGRLDLYGGFLDGINWRVTLSPGGQVLSYDAIHNCGCYHTFFVRPEQTVSMPSDTEPLLVQRVIFPDQLTQRPVVSISAAEHQIVGLRFESLSKAQNAMTYACASYDMLYQLTDGTSVRSAFNMNGLIDGTSRLESYLLWPSGVPDPGAMRMRGKHVTAFIGQRYFDDPYLHSRILGY